MDWLGDRATAVWEGLGDLPAEGWSAVAALAALALSLYNYWKLWFRDRIASLEARREYRHSVGHRLVIVNHGPAAARDVHVSLDLSHIKWETGPDSHGNPPDRPQELELIPVLHPGQKYYYDLWANSDTARQALLSWKDQRIRKQKIDVYLSVDRR